MAVSRRRAVVATTTAGIFVKRSVKKAGAEKWKEGKRVVLRVRVENVNEKEKNGGEEDGGEEPALFVTVREANGGRNAAESGGIVAARFAPPPKMGEVVEVDVTPLLMNDSSDAADVPNGTTHSDDDRKTVTVQQRIKPTTTKSERADVIFLAVSARLDADGNAATRGEFDLVGRAACALSREGRGNAGNDASFVNAAGRGGIGGGHPHIEDNALDADVVIRLRGRGLAGRLLTRRSTSITR